MLSFNTPQKKLEAFDYFICVRLRCFYLSIMQKLVISQLSMIKLRNYSIRIFLKVLLQVVSHKIAFLKVNRYLTNHQLVFFKFHVLFKFSRSRLFIYIKISVILFLFYLHLIIREKQVFRRFLIQ